MPIDDFDRAILGKLVQDGTATQAELGETACLSGPAAGRRQRLLEQQGYILGYHARLDFARFGFGTQVVVLIQLEKQSTETLTAFEEAVCASSSVLSCHLLSGSEDYLLLLRARDLDDFERIHRDELSKLPGVARMQSLFSLREVLSRTASPSLLEGRNRAQAASGKTLTRERRSS